MTHIYTLFSSNKKNTSFFKAIVQKHKSRRITEPIALLFFCRFSADPEDQPSFPAIHLAAFQMGIPETLGV